MTSSSRCRPRDCYVAGFILHDWSDGEAARILSRVHEAAAVPHARLVLVETVLDRCEAPEVAALLDLTMLGMLTAVNVPARSGGCCWRGRASGWTGSGRPAGRCA
ncbi:methyltransferase [Kitasatospora albolonga]|uniref:methyltransferase n=1 Tax=Kitasatospora albolonga TaxID=68173 RepID=UPI003CD08ABD